MLRKPRCIIVTGQPGSGKSTLSKLLGPRLRMPVISRDEIKEGYVNTLGAGHDELPPGANGTVSDLFFDLVSRYLAGHVSIIIEAAFQHGVWAPRAPVIAELAEPFIIVCTVDAATAAKRYRERALSDGRRAFYHGGKPAPDHYTPPALALPTLRVSTEGEYAPGIEEIVRRIETSGGRF